MYRDTIGTTRLPTIGCHWDRLFLGCAAPIGKPASERHPPRPLQAWPLRPVHSSAFSAFTTWINVRRGALRPVGVHRAPSPFPLPPLSHLAPQLPAGLRHSPLRARHLRHAMGYCSFEGTCAQGGNDSAVMFWWCWRGAPRWWYSAKIFSRDTRQLHNPRCHNVTSSCCCH